MKKLLILLALFGMAQAQEKAQKASVNANMDGGHMIIEATGIRAEAPLFYNTEVKARATIKKKVIAEEADIVFSIIQGKAERLSVELVGKAEVKRVEGERIASWAVREEKNGGVTTRFLDVVPSAKEGFAQVKARVFLETKNDGGRVTLSTYGPANKAGFSAQYEVKAADGMDFRMVKARGLSKMKNELLKTTTRAELAVESYLSGTADKPVEWTQTSLRGEIDAEKEVGRFTWSGVATVTGGGAANEVELTVVEPGFADLKSPLKVDFLSGRAAPSTSVSGDGYRLVLEDGIYRLRFDKAGVYPLEIAFVAKIVSQKDWRSLAFSVPGGAVVPVNLDGLLKDVVFAPENSVLPIRIGKNVEMQGLTPMAGFLPADGRMDLRWNPEGKAEEGKLFFTTTAQSEVSVGAGLVRQETALEVKTLQGELDSLDIALAGQGEILDVDGARSWSVEGDGNERVLKIRFANTVKKGARLQVKSQTALAALPAEVEPLRLTPRGAVRNSGFLRLANQGAVKLEVAGAEGLTQLSPAQSPQLRQEAASERQVFYYRYPAEKRAYEVAVSRVLPEISISQLLVYELTESDRVLRGDVELDIREAGIREYEMLIPADYPVVTVTGAEVSDYVLSDPEKGMRRLKILFTGEVSGRRLVSFHLEKNESAEAGAWTLPVPRYPDAKDVRGQIGIGAVPGFRLGMGKMTGLVEIPLAHFQKQGGNLQQTYRLRGEDWQAELGVEALGQNVQADLFHLYALKEGVAYVSVLANYFVTGAPVDEWKLALPEGARNVQVEGREVRDSRQENGRLLVPLHRSVMGAYQLLVTYEQDAGDDLALGNLRALDVQGERGFVQVVSPEQVALTEVSSAQAVKLDPLELPAEYRLMSHTPSLAAWQYTGRPFTLKTHLEWHEPVAMAKQVVEFCQLESQVARDGSVATTATFEVRTQGVQTLRVEIPPGLSVWEVKVDGEQVTSRESEGGRLVPLPGARDENVPARVELRLGQEASGEVVNLLAPTVAQRSQLTTRWTVRADEGRVLQVENAGLMTLQDSDGAASGFDWIAGQAMWEMVAVTLLVLAGFAALRSRRFGVNFVGAMALVLALGVLCQLAWQGFSNEAGLKQELSFVLPVLAPDVPLQIAVAQGEEMAFSYSGLGLILLVVGLGTLIWAGMSKNGKFTRGAAALGALLFSFGLLLQTSGAGWFFAFVALALVCIAWPRLRARAAKWRAAREKTIPDGKAASAGAVGLLVAGMILVFGSGFSEAKTVKPEAVPPLPERAAADELTEVWQVNEKKGELVSEGKMTFTASKAGQEFLLLRAPAVLRKAEGAGFKVEKVEEAGGWSYVVVALAQDRAEVSFSYELKFAADERAAGIPLLAGSATARSLRVRTSAKKTSATSPAALLAEEAKGGATLLRFGAKQDGRVFLEEKKREIAAAERRFYVEMSNLFVPGPGVVDGRHELRVRPSQGKVKELELSVPKGFTVGEVRGKELQTWRFDPEKALLKITLDEAREKPFSLLIETQRPLAELPVELSLKPLRVRGAAGEVGTVGLAFGADAQLDQAEAEGMSAVALTDFNANLLPRDAKGRRGAALRQVYRYAKNEASLSLKVIEVKPELRVTTREVLSLGEERVLLRTNLRAKITRAGMFGMSFVLPKGFEVESLSGTALSHWTETKEGAETVIVLHFNGKTIGRQDFALSLVGATPTMAGENELGEGEVSAEKKAEKKKAEKKEAEKKEEKTTEKKTTEKKTTEKKATEKEGVGETPTLLEWAVPRVIVREATRQSGELVVAPGRGIQLKETARKDVSALDPRELGGNEPGSLAYRLLQKSWRLSLNLARQEPWVTAKFLQDVELREEQVKSRVDVRLQIERASLRSLRLRLPDLSENDARTVRASGMEVRDLVPVEGEKGLWELSFKRRVVGEVAFRIEYGVSGREKGAGVLLQALEIPTARQVEGYLALRPGLRLELGLAKAEGWQESDWATLPKDLLTADRAESPALLLREKGAAGKVALNLKRHEVAESLRLRVREGELRTILSAGGELANEALVTLQVMQAGSLSLRLPPQSELLGVFVNEESTRVVRDGEAYVFQVNGDAGRDRALVRFYYVTKAPVAGLEKISLEAFRLGLPLENVTWQVSLPKGYELEDAEGDLDLQSDEELAGFDLTAYRAAVKSQNEARESETRARLDKVSGFLREGEQQKAVQTLGQVSNAFALDAASNEDARVQLQALQRRQAVIALNTRKQRLFYDNQVDLPDAGAKRQVIEAAVKNPVFRGKVNYRQGDYGRLLQGNTLEENRVMNAIAGAWVAQQQGTEPVPRLLKLVLAEGGRNYHFHRGIQVDGDKALRLELKVARENVENRADKSGVMVLVIILVLGLCGGVFFTKKAGKAEKF